MEPFDERPGGAPPCLRKQESETQGADSRDAIRLTRPCADDGGHRPRDAIRFRTRWLTSQLDEQDGDRPTVASMSCAFLAERRHPVDTGVELDRAPHTIAIIGTASRGGIGSVEERLDVVRGALVHLLIVMMLGQDELSGPAWSGGR